MARSIKPQIENLQNVYGHLSKIVASLEDAQKAQIMPSFFDYLSPNNVHTLEQQNARLKQVINSYEGAFSKIDKHIDSLINILEGLKE
ncbi:hypothetical protein ACFX5K_05295 [Rickettsiales bacterium LUAb2]